MSWLVQWAVVRSTSSAYPGNVRARRRRRLSRPPAIRRNPQLCNLSHLLEYRVLRRRRTKAAIESLKTSLSEPCQQSRCQRSTPPSQFFQMDESAWKESDRLLWEDTRPGHRATRELARRLPIL